MRRIFSAMGVTASDFHSDPLAFFVFCLNSEGKTWPKPLAAIIALFWRIVYQHMTALERSNHKFYPPNVKRDLARIIMRMLLNFQQEKKSFIISRTFTKKTNVLPKSAASQVAPWGTLDLYEGTLEIRSELRAILEKHKMWTTF